MNGANFLCLHYSTVVRRFLCEDLVQCVVSLLPSRASMDAEEAILRIVKRVLDGTAENLLVGASTSLSVDHITINCSISYAYQQTLRYIAA